MTDAPSVIALMRDYLDRFGERRAVGAVSEPCERADATWWSYAELDEQARAIAAWLRERGEPGARVMLLFPNGLGVVGAFFGCLYAGMIAVPGPVPDSNTFARRRLRGMAEDADVSFVLTEKSSVDAVAAWAEEFVPTAALLGVDGDPLGDPAAWTAPAVDRDTIALMQYTSGSTAASKGALVSHGNLLHNLHALLHAVGMRQDAGLTIGGWIPNHHDMGLMGHILQPLLSGNTSVLMKPTTFVRRPETWLRLIDRFDIEFSAAPSFAFELATRRVSDEQLADLDLSRWRLAMNGSEPVRASVLAAFTERFAAAGFRAEAMVPSYGMAEATLFVSATPDRVPVVRRAEQSALERHQLVLAEPGQPYRELVSCGVVGGAEARIVDVATGRVLDDGTVGEIWLRGTSIAQGYWGNHEATDAAFGRSTADGASGFLRTGDLGLLYEGELYIAGRLKEMLIIRGRNLYPQDVEHELRADHEALASTLGAVFAVPDTDSDAERLIVLHEYRGDTDKDVLAGLAVGMRKTVAKQFGVWAAEVLLVRPGTVRRTTSGKIQRSAMRELYLTDEIPTLHRAALAGGDRW